MEKGKFYNKQEDIRNLKLTILADIFAIPVILAALDLAIFSVMNHRPFFEVNSFVGGAAGSGLMLFKTVVDKFTSPQNKSR
jgi:hypothetical protein